MQPFEIRGETFRPKCDVQLETRGAPVVLHPEDTVTVEDVSSDCETGGFYVTFRGKKGSLPFAKMEKNFVNA